MAKEIQPRRPQPQKGLTQTYSAPNPRAPQAPAELARPLPYNPSTANAAMRLAGALSDTSRVFLGHEQERIDAEERIRISKMSQAEAESELRHQAREAEKLGVLAFGTNPYRIKVASQYAAERLMNTGFADALTKSTAKYANPLNTNTDPAKFALDTFRSMEFPGHYAQARAAEMYEGMTSRWLSQVRQQKAARAVKQNQHDLRSATYDAFQRLRSDEIQYGDFVEEMERHSDTYYSLSGDAGRDHVVAGLMSGFRHEIQEALRTGGSSGKEDLESLENLFNYIEEHGKGALDLSKSHAEDWGQIEAALDEALDTIGDTRHEDIRDGMLDAQGMLATWIGEREREGLDLPVATTEEAAEEFRQSLIGAGINPTAVERFMVEQYSKVVSGHLTGNSYFPKDVEQGFIRQLNEVDDHITRTSLIATWAAENDLPDAVVNRLSEYSLKIRRDNALHHRMMFERPDGTDRRTDVEAEVGVQSDYIAGLGMGDMSVPQELASAVTEWVGQAIKHAGSKEYSTDEARQNALDGAADGVLDVLKSSFDPETGDYDLESAEEKGAPANVLAVMRKQARKAAEDELRLRRGRMLTDLDEAPGAPDKVDQVGLEAGWWWSRPMYDNIDESADDWKVVDAAAKAEKPLPAFNMNRISRYNAEMRADAIKKLEEIRNYRKSHGWAGSTRLTIKPDGVYVESSGPSGASGGQTRSDTWTREYTQAKRRKGLALEEMERGVDEDGFEFLRDKKFKDPALTLMVNPDTWEKDITEVGKVNTDDMPQEELIEALPKNNIILHYQAYVGMVGENDAVGLNTFIDLTRHGIGRYTLPALDYRPILGSDNSE